MSNVNKVILVGRLGQDPVLKQSTNNQPMTTFSIATKSNHKSGEATTDWHQVRVYGKQAEACAKYLTKGELCYIEGRVRPYSFQKNGITKYYTEIAASHIKFLSGGSKKYQSDATKADLPAF